MKNQKKYPGLKILFEGLFLLWLVIPWLYLANYLYQDDIEARNLFSIIGIIIGFLIYVIVAIYQYNSYKRFLHNSLIKDKMRLRNLSDKPLKVYLNYSGLILEEAFLCYVQKNEDGKLVCKIRVKDEIVFETPEKFLRYFHIDG